jgi:hypothetical protein
MSTTFNVYLQRIYLSIIIGLILRTGTYVVDGIIRDSIIRDSREFTLCAGPPEKSKVPSRILADCFIQVFLNSCLSITYVCRQRIYFSVTQEAGCEMILDFFPS